MHTAPTPGEEAIPITPLTSRSSLRIESLDVLRGIAVLGALLVSIWVFGGFSTQQQNHLLLQSKGGNYRLFGAIDLLFNGKMRAMIALVFGAAIILFFTKQKATYNRPPGDVFINRQFWLLLMGLANAVVFLWTQDILFHLGIMGILLFPFIRLSYRGLFIAALITTLIYCGKNYWHYSDKQKVYGKYLAVTALEKKYQKDSVNKAAKGIKASRDTLSKLQKEDKQAWEGLLSGMKPDLKKDDPNNNAMRSNNYGKIWNHVLPALQSREAQWTYQFGFWDLASMIFLGMALYKIGFFDHRFSRNNYQVFGLLFLTAGLLLGWFRLHFLQISLQDFTRYVKNNPVPHDILFPIERCLTALGYTCLVLFFLAKGFMSRLWKAFSCVGQLSLTNYLMQSLFCTIFFYGYGMGYYGRLSQLQLYFIVAELIMVQIVFSVLWLKHFHYGPAEWLLRRLSYGRQLQPIAKPTADTPIETVLN
jgi:uncharacterized protein